MSSATAPASHPQAEVDVQVGDFVCFEHHSADRDWRNSVAKILSFPTAHRARIAWYDRVSTVSAASERVEAELRAVAERGGRLALWEAHQEFAAQLRAAAAEEDRASAALFTARAATLARQSAAAVGTRAALERLSAARRAVEGIPPRQWRDMRAPGRPAEGAVPLARAMMLALGEDRAVGWEAMQAVMRQPDFMDRVFALDAAAAPLAKGRRKKMAAEMGGRKGSLAKKEAAESGTQLELAMREWLRAQVACSEAREAEDAVVDDCFAEHQEQAVLVREVNSMRETMSQLQEKMMENKLAICGDTPLAGLLLEDGTPSEWANDTLFYQRTDAHGRPVTEIIACGAILVSFGHKAEETESDGHIFVRLTPEEVSALRSAVGRANDEHDLQELEELFAASEREEEEIRELRQRMEELRRKDIFTEDDEEEMRQLDALLTNVIRRHETTQWRIRHLQKAGRDKLFLQARLEADLVYSELHVKFSGTNWQELIENEVHRSNLEGAFCRGMSKALGLPLEYVSNIRFSLGSLMIDFTVRHSRDVDAEYLQALANVADLSEFMGYYEKVTFRKTYPLNTAEQVAAFQRTAEYAREVNFAGAGLMERLEDFIDSEEDGESDDEDFRRARVELALVRVDFDPVVRDGYPLYALSDLPFAVILRQREAEARELANAQQAEEEAEEKEEAEGHATPIAGDVEEEPQQQVAEVQEELKMDTEYHEINSNDAEEAEAANVNVEPITEESKEERSKKDNDEEL